MKTITVHRAADLGTTRKIRPVTIIIGPCAEEALPKRHTLEQWKMLVTAEGNTLATALIDTLPQGVLEVVLCRLLAARASAYMGRLGS